MAVGPRAFSSLEKQKSARGGPGFHGASGHTKRPPVWVAFFLSFALFSEYQIGVEKLPNFFGDFGLEIVCFVGLLLWFGGLRLDKFSTFLRFCRLGDPGGANESIPSLRHRAKTPAQQSSGSFPWRSFTSLSRTGPRRLLLAMGAMMMVVMVVMMVTDDNDHLRR
jgi:hypothetical protein